MKYRIVVQSSAQAEMEGVGVLNSSPSPEPASIFKWETLTEIGTRELQYQDRTVPGKIMEVELTSDEKLRVWRADNRQDYFCHGLTFGGKAAPGGVVSPLSDHIPTILRGYYDSVPNGQARPGDILVWRGPGPAEVVHSAILVDPILNAGGNDLDYSAVLRTKNGILPETNMTLGKLIENFYGESYAVYRRR
jgi:hypothetical protein